LDNLISYKKQAIDEKKQREAKQAETTKRSDVDKKIIYNNSSHQFN